MEEKEGKTLLLLERLTGVIRFKGTKLIKVVKLRDSRVLEGYGLKKFTYRRGAII